MVQREESVDRQYVVWLTYQSQPGSSLFLAGVVSLPGLGPRWFFYCFDSIEKRIARGSSPLPRVLFCMVYKQQLVRYIVLAAVSCRFLAAMRVLGLMIFP